MTRNAPTSAGGGEDTSSDEDNWVDSSPVACSRPPVLTLLPCPKGVNGLFLSAAGMGSRGLTDKDEKARYGIAFWVVVVCVEGTQYPQWRDRHLLELWALLRLRYIALKGLTLNSKATIRSGHTVEGHEWTIPLSTDHTRSILGGNQTDFCSYLL